MGSHRTSSKKQGRKRRPRSNFRPLQLAEGDFKSIIHPESAAETQDWLGPYPVLRALPAFENVTFRKLRGTVQRDRSLMTQKEVFEGVKIRREVRRRKQQAQKLKIKKERRQLIRKKRREQHERNTLNRRARGLLSHRVLHRYVGQKEDADSIWLLTEKVIGSSEHRKRTALLASKTENDLCLKTNEEKDWEDSDSDEQDEDQDSDYSAGSDNQEMVERQECDGMEYDDASGELIITPRKWGKWFNEVRKIEEEEDEFS